MKKFIILFLSSLILLSCFPANASRPVSYTIRKCYIYAQPSTKSARISIPKNTKLYYYATIQSFFQVRVANFSRQVYIKKTDVKPLSTPTPKLTIQNIDWFKSGYKIVPQNSTSSLYFIKTNQFIKVKRLGGTNHIDAEPLTSNDTAALLKLAGGTFSWQTHPCILIYNSNYIACSINTMPHGSQSIKDNNYNGQFCIHMLNSKTHGSNKINKEHQNSIKKVLDWARDINFSSLFNN